MQRPTDLPDTLTIQVTTAHLDHAHAIDDTLPSGTLARVMALAEYCPLQMALRELYGLPEFSPIVGVSQASIIQRDTLTGSILAETAYTIDSIGRYIIDTFDNGTLTDTDLPELVTLTVLSRSYV